MAYPKPLANLIATLRRLPGVGTRTAERYAFGILEWQQRQRRDLTDAIATLETDLTRCKACGCLSDVNGCAFCRPSRQATQTVCVLATLRDAFSIEETGAYRGLYHVLGGLLSPIDGMNTSHLAVDSLIERIATLQLQEVILALDATLEGDATALYLKEQLRHLPIKVSRLAFGIPIGSAFTYVDGSTLARAFTGRATF